MYNEMCEKVCTFGCCYKDEKKVFHCQALKKRVN